VRYLVVIAVLVTLATADVPTIAGAPEPAEPAVAAREESPTPPKPRTYWPKIDLWPFVHYESDPVAQTSRLRILGALLEYRTSADRLWFHFRPFLSISQSRVGHDDDVDVLYPLLTSHWGQTDQVTQGLGGLFTYRTRTSADGRTLESQRARLFPVYFYDWEHPQKYGRFSVAPFYADVEDVFGYERVQMVMFPAYLRVQQPGIDRRYYLFPLWRDELADERDAVTPTPETPTDP
jgi:hypothetical protein